MEASLRLTISALARLFTGHLAREGTLMRFCALLIILLALCAASFAQTPAPSSECNARSRAFQPRSGGQVARPLHRLLPVRLQQVDQGQSHSADQGGWGTFNSLALWNIAAVHDTLEEAAQPSPNRTPVQQKVGDYYAACMNEEAINKAGIAPLQPELDRIAGSRKVAAAGSAGVHPPDDPSGQSEFHRAAIPGGGVRNLFPARL